ncbi:MAG TPA: hypothetical protein VFF06_36690 [Polyangia bacterium]|nr:hypothetical protein [Polyangia bacterium]
MVGRATRDALLKLRRVAELDARRAMEAARADLRKAQSARGRAQAALDAAETTIWRTQLRSSKAGRAGELQARAEFLEVARGDAASAREKLRKAERAVDAAERAAESARSAAELALRAREAAQAYETAQALGAARKQNRRDDASSDDRWRRRR